MQPHVDPAGSLLTLVRQLTANMDDATLPSFRKDGRERTTNERQVQQDAWAVFTSGRERRERDLLYQQQRALRELDTDAADSLRRGDIRLISLRWMLETQPRQMLRRQELEAQDSNSSRCAAPRRVSSRCWIFSFWYRERV
jgi:hypothetical protein